LIDVRVVFSASDELIK